VNPRSSIDLPQTEATSAPASPLALSPLTLTAVQNPKTCLLEELI
jgi:hypothetical protein